MSEKIKMRDGDAILIMVKDGSVIHHTFNMSLPHAEFVKRATGKLPDGAGLERLPSWTARLLRLVQNISSVINCLRQMMLLRLLEKRLNNRLGISSRACSVSTGLTLQI